MSDKVIKLYQSLRGEMHSYTLAEKILEILRELNPDERLQFWALWMGRP